MASHADPVKPLKRRRVTRACDYCHKRSVRCVQAGEDTTTCRNCLDFGQACTFNRVPKKRGAPPKASQSNRDDSTAASDGLGTPGSTDRMEVAPHARIMDLVELYFEIVYPIFPFFHRPSFLRRVSRAEYAADRSLFGVIMAVCALTSARVRDGAVSNPRWNTQEMLETPPHVFYEKAREELKYDPMLSDLNAMRSHAILAIASIQNGLTREMHYHIGQYHTLVALDGLHDEAEWPQAMGIVEREERRRLFWSIYTLDIYTSIVWGGVVKGREQQYKVSYPIEVDDELISDAMPPPISQTNATQNWLYGWNFITDLYRILEHALARFRESKGDDGRQTSFLREIFFRDRADNSITVASVRDHVMQMYLALPDCFKQTPRDITFDSRKDIYGFQAANITATVQLLRMVLFSVNEGSVSLNDRCQIASEVIDAFWSIPDAYQQAISAPLLHHLGGIGFVLGGSAMGMSDYASLEEGEWLYNRLRSVMLDLARLLKRLEGTLASARVSERLETQVARIDERRQRQQQQLVPAERRPLPPQVDGTHAVHGYNQGQIYDPSQLPAPTYDQTALQNTGLTPHAQIGGEWDGIVFPENVFGDFSWAFNSM